MGFWVLVMELFSQREPWRRSLLPCHVQAWPDIFKNETKFFLTRRSDCRIWICSLTLSHMRTSWRSHISCQALKDANQDVGINKVLLHFSQCFNDKQHKANWVSRVVFIRCLKSRNRSKLLIHMNHLGQFDWHLALSRILGNGVHVKGTYVAGKTSFWGILGEEIYQTIWVHEPGNWIYNTSSLKN